MKKYIVALDLDETLLNSKRELSLRNQKTLQLCKNAGMKLAISSARGFGSCKKFANEINADYICCQAGNMIVDQNGTIIYKNAFKKTIIKEIIDKFSKYTDCFVVDSDFDLYGTAGDTLSQEWGVVVCDKETLLSLNAYKICVQYEEYYRKEIEKYCEEQGFVCREMRGEPLLLITPANSDKFYALEKLIEIENTDLEHLIVFGDDTSDILSIEKAGYGVAMKNSRSEVKEMAKYLTLSNDEDGVAAFLEEKFNIKNEYISKK